MANEIYEHSWWGEPKEDGWGGIYYEYKSAPSSGVFDLTFDSTFE